MRLLYYPFFFFQAEDGIRVHCVTGVQTCALPISRVKAGQLMARLVAPEVAAQRAEAQSKLQAEIGRASCRERVYMSVVVIDSKDKMVAIAVQETHTQSQIKGVHHIGKVMTRTMTW